MAGGTSIWFSKDAKTDPKAIFNLRLLYLVVAVAWAGCFYGFDSGNIGGILTLPSFKRAFGLENLSAKDLDDRSVSLGPLARKADSLTASSGDHCCNARSWRISWRFMRSSNGRFPWTQIFSLHLGYRFSCGRYHADDCRLQCPPRWSFHWWHGCRCKFYADTTIPC